MQTPSEGGEGKTDARLGTNKRFKIWYQPYQLVATQWISNSAGNQIEIEKGQIEYWEKGSAGMYLLGLEAVEAYEPLQKLSLTNRPLIIRLAKFREL